MENEIAIYTDGSCIGNPGPGGFGVIILQGDKEVVLEGGQPDTTNNRMEMTAILEALKWMGANLSGASVKIYSDSNLLVQSLREGWKRKANLDIWGEIDKALIAIDEKKIRVEWFWVKAHVGNEYNEKVDKVAFAQSKKQPKSLSRKESGDKAFKPMDNAFFCNRCKIETKGRLSYMPDADMIRLDCLECGGYIMFAEKTPKNLKEAKKRMLISKRQLKEVVSIKEDQGEVVGEKQLSKIKAWTQVEAEKFLAENQKLF